MTVLRSILLFVLAALAEIGGAWLVWQGIREHRGWAWVGAGMVALGLYGFVATLQPDAHFGRILAAYGGVFVAGSLAWGMALDGFRPDRYDVAGAVWLYGANMIALSVASLAISRIAARESGHVHAADGPVKLGMVILAALLSMVASLWSPDWAMLSYLLILATPLVTRAMARPHGTG